MRKTIPVTYVHPGDILIITDTVTGGEAAVTVESADWDYDRDGVLFGSLYFTNDTDKIVREGDEITRAGRVK